MGIENFELYSEKLNNILDEVDNFCKCIECESSIAMKKGRKNSKIEKIIDKIKQVKTSQEDEKKVTREKTNVFLYLHAVNFLQTDKIKQGSSNFTKKFTKHDCYS